MTLDQIIFDIETMPLSTATLEAQMPEFTAPANLKNPLKIEDAIEEKRQAYIERAALSPLTGRVAMIGHLPQGKIERGEASIDHLIPDNWDDDAELDKLEATMLETFFGQLARYTSTGYTIVGFNSHGFDLPFLIKRSMALRVKTHLPPLRGRYPFNPPFIDLADNWKMGRKEDYISLDELARFLRVGRKNGDGSQVATLLKSQRQKAIDYCKNDLALTADVARLMLY